MPLEIGATLPTKWRRLNGNYQMAVVIERRPLPNGNDTEYEYYMHYEGCECHTSHPETCDCPPLSEARSNWGWMQPCRGIC